MTSYFTWYVTSEGRLDVVETVRLHASNFHVAHYMGHDEPWWIERVTWYNQIGQGPVDMEELQKFFHTSFMLGSWGPLMAQMQKVHAFWEEHPQLEGLVCK